VVPGTGLHPRPGSASSLKTYFPEIDPSWSSVWYPPRKGEDVEELYKRTSNFLNVFIPEVERRLPTEHKRILVMSHAGTAIGLTRALLADGNTAMRIGCCTLTELVRKDAPSGPTESSWEANRVGDGSYLTDPKSLRAWGFEDIVIADGKASCSSFFLYELYLRWPTGRL
jgi:transcription factor C subunit 7